MIYVIYIFFLLVFLEIISVYTHPGLVNQIHKSVDNEKIISKGITAWFKEFKLKENNVTFRYHSKKNPYYNNEVDTELGDNINVFVFGDSVTGGFGVTYQDAFPNITQELLNYTYSNDLKIFSVNRFGNNLRDVIFGINLIEEKLKKDDIIIFQFNYNDIVEVNYKPEELKKLKPPPEPSKLKIILNDFRKNYLNTSTFLRVLQHYAGNIKWKIKKINSLKNIIIKKELFKKCGSLGSITLGQYTYSYGAKEYDSKSKEIWKVFENDLISLNEYLKNKKLKFAVLISPISLQVSKQEKINARDLNFECSTIDARDKIKTILNSNSIDMIDPLDDFNKYAEISYFNENYDNMYLFHPYDTNHPNKIGHFIMGKKLYSYLFNQFFYK